MIASNESRLENPPAELCRIKGVAGILFQQDGNILINDMPLTGSQVERIAALTRMMCEGFRKARRVLRQVIIGHAMGVLLVHSRDNAQLVLLLLDETALDEAAAAATSFMTTRLDKPLRLPTAPAAD